MKLSTKLTLPREAVTQTFAILGIRGSGKTTTATVFAEELLAASDQVIIIDPVDVWWGLRSSRDGRAAGHAITIIGGDHADLPLEASAGSVLADFVVEHGISVVLSTRHLSMNDQRRLITDFAERLYERKGKAEHRSPLQLILDEADAFVHQRIPAGHERLFGAIDRLVRRGRSSGIGVTLISQRPQVLHKDVLSQMEVLICHKILGPQDRKALEAWVEAHDTEGKGKEFLSSLASLRRGEAWVWSPGWLDIFARVQIRDRKTFDSSATPKVGEKRVTPKALAPVDLDALREQMSSTIEKAKADDPRELRKRIAELERAAKLDQSPDPDPEALSNARQDGFTEGWKAASEAIRAAIAEADKNLKAAVTRVTADLNEACGSVSMPQPSNDAGTFTPVVKRGETIKVFPPRRYDAPARKVSGNSQLAGGERKILSALAQFPQGRTKTQIALMTQYSHNGGGFNNYLSALRSKGYIDGRGDNMQITEAGRAALGSYDPLPTGGELLEHWMRQPIIGKAERSILQALRKWHTLTKEELAEATGYTANGGGFNNALSRLRTLELINGRGDIRLSEDLR